jgi:hypothetical protein
LADQSWFKGYSIFFFVASLKFTLERENHFPIVLHADDRPTVLECEQEVTEETEKQFSAMSVSSL